MLAVAAAGAVSCGFTETDVTVEIQVLSPVLLTKILCDPGETPVKVVEA